MAVNLTPGTISMLMTGKETVREPVVQVIKIKCIETVTEVNSNGVEKKKSYDITLSDGSVCQKVGIDDEIDEMISSKQLQKGSVVQLTDFSSTIDDFSSYIYVHDLNVIRCNCKILGDPKPFSGNKSRHVEKPPTSKQKPSTSTQKCSSHSPTQNKKRKLQSSDDIISGFGKDVSTHVSMIVEKTIEDGLGACYKTLGTLEEGVSKMTKLMMEKSKEVEAGFKKLETLEEDVSKVTKLMMEKSKEVDAGLKKLEKLEEDVSRMTIMMMEKNKEVDVGFKKLETLEEHVSKLAKMMMDNNKEDDMGACFEKLDKIGWVAQDPMYDTAILLFGQSADYRKLWLHLKPDSCGNWVKNAGSMFGLLD